MSKYTAEFRALTAIYHQAESRLNSTAISDAFETGIFADSILRQCDCLANIERMNEKVDQLCDSWKRVESQMDLQSRNETRTAMAEAKAEALRLKQVCESHRMKLEAARERLGAELGILGKRTQHLKSIQPIKNNYPKFIDSLY
jgi:hypothetical protein